ncbi:PREDICTED: capZ-interacting protein [Myotis davidii]|uniref:capZ-interacting protein n=1 Tax=Myotis davidii TaxID=225400 RepID=UPI000766FC58|nr:PREDICTED: capZ-interacting protein [Myotis davidii]
MEERPTETNANVDNSASPSVAQLAGRFREQAAAAKEMPASKPARRKPPCSLPLFPPKVELGQNGEEKSPPSTSHLPKVKVKSSPLIEKLQANLAFDPAALLPGASPKSPGLKATVSPFHSPPSTPSSPSVRSRASEPEEVPISFDQPPEGSHLPCYNKVLPGSGVCGPSVETWALDVPEPGLPCGCVVAPERGGHIGVVRTGYHRRKRP